MTVYLVNSGNLSFWYNVSSEATYDFLHFSIDGVEMGSWSGTVPWTAGDLRRTRAAVTRSPGRTRRDGSVNSGPDAAWVDFVEMPATAVPDIAVSPASLTKSVPPGQTGQQTLTLSNTGGAPLTYSTTILPARRRCVSPT